MSVSDWYDTLETVVFTSLAVVCGLQLIFRVLSRVLLWYANRGKPSAADERLIEFRDKQAKEGLGSSSTTKGRCPDCQHLQTVPMNVSAYECDQCHAKLRRPTGPIEPHLAIRYRE